MSNHGIVSVYRDREAFETHLLCRCSFDAHAFGFDGIELVRLQHSMHVLREQHDRLDNLWGTDAS